MAELYDAHAAGLRRFARSLSSERPTAAEDLVHEVFVALPRALRRFRGEGDLASFLLSIAANKARNHLRSAMRARAALQRDVRCFRAARLGRIAQSGARERRAAAPAHSSARHPAAQAAPGARAVRCRGQEPARRRRPLLERARGHGSNPVASRTRRDSATRLKERHVSTSQERDRLERAIDGLRAFARAVPEACGGHPTARARAVSRRRGRAESGPRCWLRRWWRSAARRWRRSRGGCLD